MRNQQPYLVFLDFFITMIGAFAIYSTNFIAYSNSIPIIGSLYGISIVIRGFLPLLVHKNWLFRNLPIVHLSFLFLVVTFAILFNNIVLYLVGISVSLFLGMFTGSYVYNLEITWAKDLSEPSKFFSLVTGAEAFAFLVAPILTYVTPDKILFLSILLSLITLAALFLFYFRYFGGVEIKPKFFSGEIAMVRKIAIITIIASLNWFLQYLWMGMVFGLGLKQGVPDTLILGAIEGETILYMAIQFAINTRGLRSYARVNIGLALICIYAIMVALFVSLTFIMINHLIFLLLLFSFAISSAVIEPLVDTLISSTDRASENSTIILSFKSIGGGLGYALSSFLLAI